MALENAIHKLKRNQFNKLERNQFNFEASRNNLQDPNTLNRLKGTFRSNQEVGYDPLKGPGTPGEERVPNVGPLRPAASSTPSGQADTGRQPDLSSMMQLAPLLNGQSTGTIPGQQPGTEFNMGAVNAPEAGRTAMPTGNKMDPYLLATILGSAGAAIGGKDTWKGRLGGNMANIASKLYGEKSVRDYEAPDKALDRELKQAKINDLGKPEDTRTPHEKELEAYQKYTPEQRTLYDKLYGKSTKEDLETFEAKEKIKAKYKGSYYRVFDDEGNPSIYKGEELVSGTGKGKTKNAARERLYQTEKGLLPASEAKGLKPWEKTKDAKNLTPAQELQRDKAVLKVEEDISEGKATMGDIGFFNKYSNNPYIYTMEKGEKKYGMFGWDFLAKDIPDSLEMVEFKTPEDVKKAFDDKTINKEKMDSILSEHFGGSETKKSGKTITQTGTYNGRKVIKYSDGSIEYAD